MLGIVGDPDLEKALALMADGSSTVDKVFLREGDFGDMEAVSYTHLTLPTNREV